MFKNTSKLEYLPYSDLCRNKIFTQNSVEAKKQAEKMSYCTYLDERTEMWKISHHCSFKMSRIKRIEKKKISHQCPFKMSRINRETVLASIRTGLKLLEECAILLWLDTYRKVLNFVHMSPRPIFNRLTLGKIWIISNNCLQLLYLKSRQKKYLIFINYMNQITPFCKIIPVSVNVD